MILLLVLAIILDDMLIFNQIDRFSSGIYVCSASNQIGPSISRRIIINVQCKQMILFGSIQTVLNLIH